MATSISKNLAGSCVLLRNYATKIQNQINSTKEFETVYSFPTIKYIALINRLKVYHMYGCAAIIPSCGMLEVANMIPHQGSLIASYIGLTGAAVLSLASLPFTNTIGHLYISKNNDQIKISSINFWGKRIDRIINTDDWMPLLQMEPKTMDAFYLTPQLSDGTKYKLFVKFGKVLNSTKIGQVLE